LSAIENLYQEKIDTADSLIESVEEKQATLDAKIADINTKADKVQILYDELFESTDDKTCKEEAINDLIDQIEDTNEKTLKIFQTLQSCFIELLGEKKKLRRTNDIEAKREQGIEILTDDEGEYWI